MYLAAEPLLFDAGRILFPDDLIEYDGANCGIPVVADKIIQRRFFFAGRPNDAQAVHFFKMLYFFGGEEEDIDAGPGQ